MSNLFKETTMLARDRKKNVHYKIYDHHLPLLKEKYKNIIQHHLDTYSKAFKAYFSTCSSSLASFDVEEIHNEIACIIGICIDREMNVDIFLESTRSKPSPQETEKMMKKVRIWLLEKKNENIVLTHGYNEKEREITKNIRHDCVNTQLLLPAILKREKDPAFTGASLSDFEELIGFKREGCAFLKHAKFVQLGGIEKKHVALLFPKQAKLSIWNLAEGSKPRTCKICGKGQDLFMYCLEDTFTTILIHLHAENNGYKL